MTKNTGTRLDDIETRLMHQEYALDELTKTLLMQEKIIKEQAETIRRMEIQLRALTPPDIQSGGGEETPPHY